MIEAKFAAMGTPVLSQDSIPPQIDIRVDRKSARR